MLGKNCRTHLPMGHVYPNSFSCENSSVYETGNFLPPSAASKTWNEYELKAQAAKGMSEADLMHHAVSGRTSS